LEALDIALNLSYVWEIPGVLLSEKWTDGPSNNYMVSDLGVIRTQISFVNDLLRVLAKWRREYERE